MAAASTAGAAAAGATSARTRRRRRPEGQARHHQPRRQGGEGRPALRLRGAGGRRRPEGPRRLGRRQGARGAGGDPQGDRAGQAHDDPRADARGPHAAPRHHRPVTAPAGCCCARRRPGTGIIAGGPMRAVFETLGMGDVVAKCIGTTNPHNMVKATFAALAAASSPRAVAARRGKKVVRPARPAAEGGAAGRDAGGGGARCLSGEEDRAGHPDRLADRPQARPAETLIGLGLNKMHRTRELEDTPRSAA